MSAVVPGRLVELLFDGGEELTGAVLWAHLEDWDARWLARQEELSDVGGDGSDLSDWAGARTSRGYGRFVEHETEDWLEWEESPTPSEGFTEFTRLDLP